MSALLDYQAAAAHLGVSVRYLRQLVREGRIAHHRLGRRVLFSADDLEAFLAESRVEPKPAPPPLPKGRYPKAWPTRVLPP